MMKSILMMSPVFGSTQEVDKVYVVSPSLIKVSLLALIVINLHRRSSYGCSVTYTYTLWFLCFKLQLKIVFLISETVPVMCIY